MCALFTAIALAAFVASTVARTSERPSAKSVGCSARSDGTFNRAFDRRRSIIVGPLVFAGARIAADEEPATIRRLGNWWKSPALVRQGHSVTVAVARPPRQRAGLLYRHQDRTVRAADKAITFKACPRNVRNDSVADGRRVTFWSGGFIASRIPACIPLDVWVDRKRAPRRVLVSLAAGECPSR
jgi:hypothetical protein